MAKRKAPPAKKNTKWMQHAVKNPGALHEALGIPADKKIPADKLAIKPEDSALMRKRKVLARTFRKVGGRKKKGK